MTVKIPLSIQAFINGKQGWVATASTDGVPNIAIKGSLRLLDDEHLMFADLFSKKTHNNLKENPKVAVMVYDNQTNQCYLFKGTAEIYSVGDLYERTVEEVSKLPMRLPKPKSVVTIAVEAIFNQSGGPEAGKQIV